MSDLLKVGREEISPVIEAVFWGEHKQAVRYVTEKEVIKATRRGKLDRRSRHTEILLSIGPPNYAEREMIKKFKRLGMVLPSEPVIKG